MPRSRTPRGLVSGLATILAIGASGPGAARAQSLEHRLERILDRSPLDRHLWGVVVLDDRGQRLFERNGERLFIPASNTKLVVTAVAAGLFPADSRVRTSVYADGRLAAGVLEGDLVLYGRGDPTWSRRCYAVDSLAPGACGTDPMAPLASLAGALKRAGIVRVAGNLIADGSYFEPLRIHPTWENDDLIFAYAAPVSALGFNENSLIGTVVPGAEAGSPGTATLEPTFPGIELTVRVATTADSIPTDLTWSREPGTWRYRVEGTIRRGAVPRRSQLAAADPDRFAGLAFERALAVSGITVLGRVRVAPDSFATRTARSGPPLAEIESRPVADWICPILNVSQNWYAEMLVKQLGRRFGTGGSWSGGIEVERRFLIDSVGIDSTQFSLHDGSGLSAKNLVTPSAFVRLLHFMRRHPHFEVFARGLPRSGAAGSLEKRFLATPMEGLVRAKTGSIGEVNTLSGYLPCRIFSVQANHHILGGQAMIDAIDSVVVAIGRSARCR